MADVGKIKLRVLAFLGLMPLLFEGLFVWSGGGGGSGGEECIYFFLLKPKQKLGIYKHSRAPRMSVYVGLLNLVIVAIFLCKQLAN